MKYIQRDLAEEIKARYALLQELDQTDVLVKCKERVEREIEREAQVHSYRLEHPRGDLPYSIPHNRKRKIAEGNGRRVKIRAGVKDIENALEWGRLHFNSEDFNESFIKSLVARITPDMYPGGVATYRDMTARINDTRFIAPSPYKLTTREMPAFIASLKEQLTCLKVINGVESAIYAHLHLARMQPFVDGNKRTARTVQNIILYSRGLPPPIIETGERAIYLNNLTNAMIGWNEMIAIGHDGEVSEGERAFFNYMAGKVNVSLDKVLTACHPSLSH